MNPIGNELRTQEECYGENAYFLAMAVIAMLSRSVQYWRIERWDHFAGLIMLDEWIGSVVVIDLRSTFVCIGMLKRIEADFLELRHVDLHDLRDTETTRENYVADSAATGVKRNRKKLLLMRGDIVAVSLLEDVVLG